MIFIYNVQLRSKVAYFIFCSNQVYIIINWKFNNQQLITSHTNTKNNVNDEMSFVYAMSQKLIIFEFL